LADPFAIVAPLFWHGWNHKTRNPWERETMEITNDGENITPPQPQASAFAAREKGMNRALYSTDPKTRAEITAAVLRGLDHAEPRRVEEALDHAAFTWPENAPPRALGGIVAGLARLGLIVEESWTKGQTKRSHAGRVSFWTKARAAV
jgi:hypothetical protein